MDIKTSFIKVSKTARYSTFGELSQHTKFFWFVLHGSNMTCEQMLFKFSEFDPRTHLIIAPEGLNRTYLEGFGGDAVASWMTKRDRLSEIEDFSVYLSTLYKDYSSRLPTKTIKIVLGFSQGGTTAYRWLHDKQEKVDCLIAYSCWIPEDINLTESQTDLASINKVYTYGTEDQFLTPKRIEALEQVIKDNKLAIQVEPYKGLHRIEKSQLAAIFKKYIN